MCANCAGIRMRESVASFLQSAQEAHTHTHTQAADFVFRIYSAITRGIQSKRQRNTHSTHWGPGKPSPKYDTQTHGMIAICCMLCVVCSMLYTRLLLLWLFVRTSRNALHTFAQLEREKQTAVAMRARASIHDPRCRRALQRRRTCDADCASMCDERARRACACACERALRRRSHPRRTSCRLLCAHESVYIDFNFV